MADLKFRQDKIKEKRSQTIWRDYIKEIASWLPLNFYKNKGLISRYPNSDRIHDVLSVDEFSEKRENLDFIDYDFTRTFWENLELLSKKVPYSNVIHYESNENSNFADVAGGSRNVYLSSNVVKGTENVAYSFSVKAGSKNVYNSFCVWNNSENIYQSVAVMSSYNIFYSKFIENSSDIWFCTNMISCQNCMFCDGLSNKKYCFKNKEYSKDEYNKFKVQSLKFKEKFLDYYNSLEAVGENKGSENISGSFICNSENVDTGNIVFQVKNGRNLFAIGGRDVCENLYDSLACGSVSTNYIYASVDTGWGDHMYFCQNVGTGTNLYYCQYLENCSYCLGCMGIKNKTYCIMNKQYEKDEWYEMVDKIFKQMEDNGIFGKYFPGRLNPFYFNDTAAYLIEDFGKDEVIGDGFMWRDEEIKVDIPGGSEIISASASVSARTGKTIDDFQGYDNDGNWQIDSEIMKKVIVDEKGNYYKIIPMEFDFLNRYGLPLPDLHWLDRMKFGFKFN